MTTPDLIAGKPLHGEIRNRDGECVAVPPVESTLVVNVGEVLKGPSNKLTRISFSAFSAPIL
jgi:isopenicillin N synthase-like dioxygenase